MTDRMSVPALVRDIAARLGSAGIDSPLAEARIIVSRVLGVEWGAPIATAPSTDQLRRVDELVATRAADRTPLQYLLGTAVSGRLDLAVGPGVFIPRPETELLVVDVISGLPTADGTGHGPSVVDLCAGSGTLALEIAHARPDARVYAVEKYPGPLGWLRHNAEQRRLAGDTPIRVHHGDATDPGLLSELHGWVDAVVSNPPYIPDGADLPEEVLRHEPAEALFGGPDGLRVIVPLVDVAARLLRPGGRLVVEHDDSTQAEVAAVIDEHGGFGTVERHTDLAGRPRYVTAVRSGEGDEKRSPR